MKWKVDENKELPVAVIEDTEDSFGVCELDGGGTASRDELEKTARLIAAAPYLYETAKEFIAGWPHFCKCINFGQSALDAKANRFMNEVPAKIATGIVKAEKGV